MSALGKSHFDTLMTEGLEVLKETFGELVTYCPRSSSAFVIDAIFDEAHTVVDTSGEVPFETVKPVLSIATADLRKAAHGDPKRGDTVVVRGKTYSIAEIMPDGRAEVRLVLSLGATRA